jgi:hypothetical protein
MFKQILGTATVLLLAGIITGCQSAPEPTAQPSRTARPEPRPIAPISSLPPPQNQLAEDEYHWDQLLPRDGIRPIYEPEFAPADVAPYEADELVIGVEINGEAKAYAIGPLNSREIVNDTLGGTPILVTW